MGSRADRSRSEGANDTDTRALRLQIRLLRGATPAQRFARQRALSSWVLALARRSIERSMPGASEAAMDVAYLRHCYGDDLARRYERWLAR